MVAGAVVGAAGVVAGAVTGAVFCAGALKFLSKLVLVLPVLKNKTETKHSTAITPAKIQVPFSSTSVVCFTPIN